MITTLKIATALAAAIGLASLYLALTAPMARAGWPDDEFKAQHRQNRVHRHVYRDRYGYHQRRRETRKVIIIRPRQEVDTYGHCKPMEHGTGTETRVSDPIKRAEAAWSANVSYKWGEVFADLKNAKSASVRCTDPRPDTAVDRAASAVGVDTSRRICRIEAVPCMAPALEWRAKGQ